MQETLHEMAARQRGNREAELSLPSGPPMPMGEVEQRLMVLREGLIGGMSRPELVALAQQQWQVSRRTAYWYMQRLDRQMTEDERTENPSAARQTIQAQRNRLLEPVMRAMPRYDLRMPNQVDMFIKLANFAARVINDRERAAREAEEGEREKTRGATIQVTAQQTIAQAVMLAAEEPADCTKAPALHGDSIEAALVHNYLEKMELCRQPGSGEQLQNPAIVAQNCTNLHSEPVEAT